MELQPKQPSTKGPAEMFTGDVYFDVIAKGEEPSRMRVNTVRFAPCARTAWHTHAVGPDAARHRGRRAGPVPRRRRRRHAARRHRVHPAGRMALARRRTRSLHDPPRDVGGPRADSGQPETEWGEHVTDDEYHVADGGREHGDQRSRATQPRRAVPRPRLDAEGHRPRTDRGVRQLRLRRSARDTATWTPAPG